MKVFAIVAGMLMSTAALADNNPLTKKCVSSSGNKELVIEFNQDLTQARVSQQTDKGLVTKATLTCERVDPPATSVADTTAPAPAPTPTKSSVHCRDTTKADAGYSAILFQTGENGLYQVELSEQSIGGPRLLALMTCQ